MRRLKVANIFSSPRSRSVGRRYRVTYVCIYTDSPHWDDEYVNGLLVRPREDGQAEDGDPEEQVEEVEHGEGDQQPGEGLVAPGPRGGRRRRRGRPPVLDGSVDLAAVGGVAVRVGGAAALGVVQQRVALLRRQADHREDVADAA